MQEVPIALANPSGACSSLKPFTTTTIVLVSLEDSLSCSYSTIASNVAASGAAAVLYARPDSGFVDDYYLTSSKFKYLDYEDLDLCPVDCALITKVCREHGLHSFSEDRL